MEDTPETNPRDIHERCLDYGVRAIKLFRHLKLQRDEASIIIGRQFLRAATSIGANLAEASAGETKADFVHKCSIAQKEAREALYWLDLLVRAELMPAKKLEKIRTETREIVAVITAIGRNAKRSKD